MVQQLGRFLVVGLGNMLVSVAVYALLLWAGTPYGAAATVAFLAGAVNGYVFNRTWTFHARDSNRARVRYAIVQVAAALLTSVLTALFVGVGAGAVGAFLAAVPPVTLAMFLANRTWTFAEPSGPVSP